MPGSKPISLRSKTLEEIALCATGDVWVSEVKNKERGAYRSWRAFICGEMYDAVTKCFLCLIQISATDGWKGTGRRLGLELEGKSLFRDEKAGNKPDDNLNLRISDQI